MNAIELLKTQHREVNQLFEQIGELQGERDAGERLDLTNQVADALAVHARIEEEIFYPACKRAEVEELLRESLEEHLIQKRLIADLVDMEPGDPQFDARCHELEEMVEHHVQFEESELMPRVERFLGQRRLEELGDEMERLATEIEERGEPRLEVPGETGAVPPL